MGRATSIQDEVGQLKKGTVLWKLRDKELRGLKVYKRQFKLDTEHLRITYLPNKHLTGKDISCVGGPGISSAITLADVSEVRIGHGTDNFNKLVKQCTTEDKNALPQIQNVNCHRDFCFSLVFNDDKPPLDLIVDNANEQTRNVWVNVINHIVVTMKSLGDQKSYELFLKKQFKQADKNGNGSLTLSECQTLIEQLNIKMSLEELEKLFQRANFIKEKKEQALNEAEFVQFYYSLLRKPELEEVFIQYASTEAKMGAKDLMKFFEKEQKMSMREEECAQIIEAFEPTTGERTSLSIEGFTHFMMFSDWHDLIDQSKLKLVYQDMEQPLSNYWIASSHNTYVSAKNMNLSSLSHFLKVSARQPSNWRE